MSRPDRVVSPRLVAGTTAVMILMLVAACGSAQPTGTPRSTALASGLPPETAVSPSATASATISPSPTHAATPDVPQPVLPPVAVSLVKVVGGLPRPIGVVSAGDSRLFVVDQAGEILIVDGGAVKGTFLDIRSRVATTGSERGLIGLAFHPGYAENGLFYVRYTVASGDVRISEFHVSSNPNKADPASERVLLTIPHRLHPNHNAGTLAFGPDGYLYIGTGDGGGAGDPNGNGQKLSVLLGKMLRIDVDRTSGKLPYAIPSDNPFVGQAGRLPQIWAYGLRNPYTFSFDRQTGDLWIADVGQNLYEEIDRATAATGLGRGANYGWSVMEANHCFRPASRCSTAGKVEPVVAYSHGSHDSVGCAVLGGFVYRGTAEPQLFGRYFFSDYCSGRIWDLTAAGPATQPLQQLADTGLRATGWGQGTDGELYLVAANGILYHLI